MLNDPTAAASQETHQGTDAPQPISDVGTDNLQQLDALGQMLRSEFDDSERRRQPQEQKWLEDLRQVKGIYDPQVMATLGPGRCKLFVRLTRAKLKAVNSKLSELLFPAGDKNWSIEPSRDPELSKEKHTLALTRLLMDRAMQGLTVDQPPTEEEVREYVKREAEKAASSMSEMIEDQLNACGYEDECIKVLHSGHLYGTGILKGPVTEIAETPIWVRSPTIDLLSNTEIPGTGPFGLQKREKKQPSLKACFLWNIYPEPGVAEPTDLLYTWERHVFNASQLVQEAMSVGMNLERVVAHLSKYPEGDMLRPKRWQAELEMLDEATGQYLGPVKGRYELFERWGVLTGKRLREHGVEVPPEFDATPMEAWVWVLGDKVVKAVLNPLVGHFRPYNWYWLDKDETSIWGEGLPRIYREMQSGFNGSIRMAFDNGGMSAGPQIEVNRALMDEEEDIETFAPFRRWIRKGIGPDAQYPALRVHEIRSNVKDHLELGKVMKDLGDEVSSAPSFAYGQPGSNAANTLGGLSMLLGQINVSLKDVSKTFDRNITEPCIRAMYNWNMAYSDREDAKGDMEVRALASSSLIAKELRSHAITGFLQITANPIDAPYTKRQYLLRELAKSIDLEADRATLTDAEAMRLKAMGVMLPGMLPTMPMPGMPMQGMPGAPQPGQPPGGKDGVPNPGEQGPKAGGDPMQPANPQTMPSAPVGMPGSGVPGMGQPLVQTPGFADGGMVEGYQPMTVQIMMPRAGKRRAKMVRDASGAWAIETEDGE